MKYGLKNFKRATSIFMLLLLADAIYAMFQTHGNGIYNTIFGVRANVIMQANDHSLDVTLSEVTLVCYLIFLLVWFVISIMINRNR